MLGKSITDLDKNEIEALGYFEFYTTELQRRVVVDTVCTCPLIQDKIIGFMNKQSRTTIVPNPLFRVESGSGNAPDRNDEGLHYKNLFASQLSGPILVRNPQLRAYIEKAIYDKKGIDTLPLYFMHEDRAYKDSLNGLTQK